MHCLKIVRFLTEDLRQAFPDTLHKRLREYIRLHTADGRLISAIAGRTAGLPPAPCSTFMRATQQPPIQAAGLTPVQRQYRPAFRRKGACRSGCKTAFTGRQRRRARGSSHWIIPKQGKPLYEKLGFEHAEHDMKLILQPSPRSAAEPHRLQAAFRAWNPYTALKNHFGFAPWKKPALVQTPSACCHR